jgi:hypothetical protein
MERSRLNAANAPLWERPEDADSSGRSQHTSPTADPSKAQGDPLPPAPAVIPNEPSGPVTVQQVPLKAVPTPVSAAAAIKEPGADSTTQKLRELAGLLKDGLITQDDYDAKKRELLRAF